MKRFGQVFVEWHDGDMIALSMIPWYRFLYGLLIGAIGGENSKREFRYIPRSKVHFIK